MRLLENKIAVKIVDRPETTRSGLYVAPTAKFDNNIAGTVTHVGPWLTTNEGDFDFIDDQNVFEIKVGETVYFNHVTAPKIKTSEGEFYIITLKDVLAVE